MISLFDMIMNAQDGKMIETFSQQMGLAQDQAEKALAALIPAFSTGLKRSASDPDHFTAMMKALSSGDYTQYFEDLNRAFSPEGIADGNEFLAQIFGSNELSRAIAFQAAEIAGIGRDMMNAMMPALASTMAGGIMKQMTGQMPQFGKSDISANPMTEMTNAWMRTVGIQPKSRSQFPDPFDNPLLTAMQTMFAQAGRSKSQTDTDPFGSDAYIRMLQAMMGTPPESKNEQKAIDLSRFSDLIDRMFESGLDVQKSYQQNMENLFDSYMKGMNAPQKETEKKTE